MADDPPSTPLTVKNLTEYTEVLTTGSLLEKATEKPDNQDEEETYAEMVSKLKILAMQQEEQYFQELYGLAKDEHKLKMHQLQKTMQQERQPALEPGMKGLTSQMSSSEILDWKEGHRDLFDIHHREKLPIHHHLAWGRWENKGTFLTKNETEPHINMYPTVKDFTLEESQEAWIQWVNDAFPDLHGTQFWLPVCAKDFASVHCTEERSTLDTSQKQAPWYNSVKNDSALQRVLLCLKERSEAKDEVMFVLSQLYFGQNFGEPCYSAAADYLPPPDSVPPAPPRNWEEGDFDLLIIHRTYGLVVCEVKAFGDNSSKSDMSQQDVDSKIRSKLKEAILQVDRAEAVLSHLVSDIVPGLRITKTIAFPNLTGHQVQQALAEDLILIEDLCRCLGATDVAGVTDLCLTSDHLFVSDTPGIVSTDFGKWWLRCVVGSGSATKISFDDYKRLLARFCGPAVTVTVPCLSPPRLSLKTLGQPSSSTSLCHAVITLFPEQVHLLNAATPRVFLAGPPGTGKSLVLQLKATEWLRCGRDVFMVRPVRRGHAASLITYYLLQQTIKTLMVPTLKSGQLYLLECDFYYSGDIEKAVTDLSQAAKGRPLYLIVDAMNSPSLRYEWRNIKSFLDKLLATVPDLHCWTTGYDLYDLEFAPSSWQVQHFTRPIRFPKSVEMELEDFQPHIFKRYSQRGQHDTTPGPPVQWFLLPKHDHIGFIGDCVTCSKLVVRFLQGLLDGASGKATTSLTSITSTRRDTTSTSLRYRDVLIVGGRYRYINLEKALENAGIPMAMTDYITEDMVTSNKDEVWMVSTDDLQGLERKVVVIVGETEPDECFAALHCTSQLVFISHTDLPEQRPIVKKRNSDTSRKYAETFRLSDTIAESTPTAGSFFQRIRNWFYYVGDTFKWAFGVKSDDKDVDKKKATEENQKGERKKLETCSKKGITNTEMKSITPFAADSQGCSTQYKITVDLKKTISLKTPQQVRMPNRLHDECDQGKATEKSKDITSSPIFSYRWQNILRISTEGGRLRGEGSDVVLTVPSGAVEFNTKVTVHTSVCINDVYIKDKLQLPSTETIVSPLAEFWAGPDFHFKKHVQITLPTCLPSDYDVDLLHVYCITREGQQEEITVNKIQRLKDMTQTPDKEALEVYFYINEERQVEVMTSHFSGYVCTYCGLCQNIGLEVYASHRFDNESVQVSVIAQFWDKLHISDFRQWKPELNSFTVVLSTTFQLNEVLKPAKLQVDLIIDDEQKTMWEFKTTPAPANTFCLNWGEIACVNSTNHPAVKYTDLGPFSPGWKLKSKTSENGVMPSTLEAFLLVSHKTQESVEPLWSSAPCQLDVQPLNGKEKCVSNGTSGNCPVINIENVHGDVTFAQQVHTQKTENVLYITENNQSTAQTMLRLEHPVKDTS